MEHPEGKLKSKQEVRKFFLPNKDLKGKKEHTCNAQI